MPARRVLVAFASQHGSTALFAQTIAASLRERGIGADCRAASSEIDLARYDAVILGSGVYLARHASDGGGFLARHADDVRRMPTWLFSAGPIGSGSPAADVPDDADHASSLARVARAIGARGAAAFGATALAGETPGRALPEGDLRDQARVREWALAIADELTAARDRSRRRARAHGRLQATG